MDHIGTCTREWVGKEHPAVAVLALTFLKIVPQMFRDMGINMKIMARRRQGNLSRLGPAVGENPP